MSQEPLLVKACANHNPHTIKVFDDETKEVGKLAMKDGALTFTGNADEAAKVFVQHVCDRAFQLTSQIKELKQEKAELLAALNGLVALDDLFNDPEYCEYHTHEGAYLAYYKGESSKWKDARAAIAKAERRDG